jgi:hypothetical protein
VPEVVPLEAAQVPAARVLGLRRGEQVEGTADVGVPPLLLAEVDLGRVQLPAGQLFPCRVVEVST